MCLGLWLWIGRLGVTALLFEKGNQRIAWITLLSLPKKAYARLLEKDLDLEKAFDHSLRISSLAFEDDVFMSVLSCGFISLHWGNFQLCVQWQEWELPPLSPRVQFSPGKGWSTHSKSEMSYLSKWKYSRPNSHVKGEWIDREIGAASAMMQRL